MMGEGVKIVQKAFFSGGGWAGEGGEGEGLEVVNKESLSVLSSPSLYISFFFFLSFFLLFK